MFFSDNITVDQHLWFNVIPTERSDEGSQKYREIWDLSHKVRDDKYTKNEREIRSLLQYFLLRVHAVFAVYRKYTNQRARNTKLASVFFTASACSIRVLPQIHEQMSEKYEACFSIFYWECRQYSRFTANTRTNEREIDELLNSFWTVSKTLYKKVWKQTDCPYR